MLSDFAAYLSSIFKEWEFLRESLDSFELPFFDAILAETADENQLVMALFWLSRTLCTKYSKKVIVFIDEYEVPNYCAYDHGYFAQVRALFFLMAITVKGIPGQPILWVRCPSPPLEGDRHQNTSRNI